MTAAPLVVKDMIVTGTGGGEYGIRGWVDAYDAETGERRWRAYTIPGPGEPGNETWEGDSWRTGGASTWMTGSYDPDLNLIYWGVGNPGPDWNGETREGDNLYSDSVIAIDADSGEIRWHFQFTPHDVHDWDACQVPVLVDVVVGGRTQKLMLFANRNGFFYVLDRETGRFVQGREYAVQTWAQGLDDSGRPIRVPDMEPTPEGRLVFPDVNGASNWWSPSYSPDTGLFYTMAYDGGAMYYSAESEYVPGQLFVGGSHTPQVSRDASSQRRPRDRPAHRPRGLGAPRAAQVHVRRDDHRRRPGVRRHGDRQLHRPGRRDRRRPVAPAPGRQRDRRAHHLPGERPPAGDHRRRPGHLHLRPGRLTGSRHAALRRPLPDCPRGRRGGRGGFRSSWPCRPRRTPAHRRSTCTSRRRRPAPSPSRLPCRPGPWARCWPWRPTPSPRTGRSRLGSGQSLPIDALRSLWTAVQTAPGALTAEHEDAVISVEKTGEQVGVTVERNGETMQAALPAAVLDAALSAEGGNLNIEGAVQALAARPGAAIEVTGSSRNLRVWIDDQPGQ